MTVSHIHDNDPMDRMGVFVTGAPRSGTSMITKVIDAHPDVAILMENIFQNRRRHWSKAAFWNSPQTLKKETDSVFAKLKEPVIGNKVCTPDVWSADDILLFCRLFKDFKIVFILRDPVQVALSRFRREDYAKEFNEMSRKNILLDFLSRPMTYASSWRQSVENYWRLRDGYPEQIYLIYYEEFCRDFEAEARKLFTFLGLPFCEEILSWCQYPHHDSDGNLVNDLKYSDQPVKIKTNSDETIAPALKEQVNAAINSIQTLYDLWEKRLI